MFPSHTGVCSCVTEFWLEMEKWNWCVQLERYSLKEKDLPFSCLLLSAVWLPEQPLCCSCPLCCCDMLFMSLSHVLLLVTPWTAAHQASLSFTISWSLLKLMSIELVMPSSHLLLCCSPSLLLLLSQSCPTLCDPIDGSPPGSCPWDSPDKNTGVGCHFLLQCMKVKSKSEVAQSCPTLRNPMNCSPSLPAFNLSWHQGLF